MAPSSIPVAPTALRRARIGDALYDIALRNGRIGTITPTGASPLLPGELDLESGLTIPSFVNCHAHLDKALLPHTATDSVEWRDGVLVSPLQDAKRGFTRSEVARRAGSVIDHAIATGTTAIRSHVDVDSLAGVRSIEAMLDLREEYADRLDLQIVAFPQEGLQDPDNVRLLGAALAMGADVVGGKPSADEDPWRHLQIVFDLAAEHGVEIDVHADVDLVAPTDTRQVGSEVYPALESVMMAARAQELGDRVRVTASHVMALDALQPEVRRRVIALLAVSGITVVVSPSASLYLHGREDPSDVRRGIAPVRELLAAGVPVAYASDNTGDAFNLYSSADMRIHALLTAISCGMRTVGDLETVLDMGTTAAAAVMGDADHRLREGAWADLVVLDAVSLYDAFTRIAPVRYVFRRGAMTWRGRGADGRAVELPLSQAGDRATV